MSNAKYCLIFQNSHHLSEPYRFCYIEHARDAYHTIRKDNKFTHYKLYEDGKIIKSGKIV